MSERMLCTFTYIYVYIIIITYVCVFWLLRFNIISCLILNFRKWIWFKAQYVNEFNVLSETIVCILFFEQIEKVIANDFLIHHKTIY